MIEPPELDAVFGRAHPIVIERRAGRVERLTTCTPIDWRAPRRIPAIAAPGTLPPGAGSAVLNLIAILAADAGVRALRYAGPYPTDALWTALGHSFRTTGDRSAFTADAAGRALRIAYDEIAIDFVPAPFERAWIPGGEVHVRDGVVERVRIDGVGFAVGGSPARLVRGGGGGDGDGGGGGGGDSDGGWFAEVWFGDAVWARVATLDEDGRIVDGPHAVPACTSAVIGAAFPPALREALGELIASLVATGLADPARGVLADEDVRWADCGAVAARGTADGLEVHAALWERIAPLGMARLAAAIAEALAPVVAVRAQLRLAAAIAHW